MDGVREAAEETLAADIQQHGECHFVMHVLCPSCMHGECRFVMQVLCSVMINPGIAHTARHDVHNVCVPFVCVCVCVSSVCICARTYSYMHVSRAFRV